MKRCKSNKGFSLVELIVVISLLAMLGTLGVANFMGTLEESRLAAQRADAERLVGALNAYNAAANILPSYPGDFRIRTVMGEFPFVEAFWGNGPTRGLLMSHYGLMGGIDRRMVIDSADANCPDPACTIMRQVNLRHYVNVWNPLLPTPGPTDGGFESSGAMAADFSTFIECRTLLAIAVVNVPPPAANAAQIAQAGLHIHYDAEIERWIVRN